MLVRCALPADQQAFQPTPFPGSPEARRDGCVCPFEQPWPGGFVFDTSCPVHELIVAESAEDTLDRRK